MEAINTDQLTNHFLGDMNNNLSEALNGDCVFIDCPMLPPLDDEFRVVIEHIKKNSELDHLVVVLETQGGNMETVERMVSVMQNTLRNGVFCGSELRLFCRHNTCVIG